MCRITGKIDFNSGTVFDAEVRHAVIMRGEHEISMLYDGEIYNKEELCCKLNIPGNFSDSEVALHAYLEWGEGCLERFNGIFAFAVWDEREQSLFIARDRLGVKPLFYYISNGLFVFASDIKTVLHKSSLTPEIDKRGMAELILIGPGRTPGYGVIRAVNELKPGHFARFNADKGLSIKQYWKLRARRHPHTYAETIDTARNLLEDSIKCRQKHDVPAEDYYSFEAEPEEFENALAETVEACGMPGMAYESSVLLIYCRKVKEHTSDILSGDCACELFQGSNFTLVSNIKYREKFAKRELWDVIKPEDYVRRKYNQTINSAETLEDETEAERMERFKFKINTDWYVRSLLERNESIGRHTGVNIRTPFCDYRLVEYLYNIPVEYKNYNGKDKSLLCDVLKGTLLEGRFEQKTYNTGFFQKIMEMLKEIIINPNEPLLDFVDKKVLEKLLDEDGYQPWYGTQAAAPQIAAYFVQINIWLKMYGIKII